MNKTGNLHSSLLDEMTKIAQAKPESKAEVAFLDEVLKKPAQPSLKEIIAQFGQEPEMAPPAMGEVPDAPMSDEGADTEGAKRGLCEALKALCGSIEEAHTCLDQFCGQEEELGVAEEDFAEPMPAQPMEAPTSGMPAPMPAPAGTF